MRETIAIILAAGKSTRMNSQFSKVLHKIYGKTMIEYVMDTIKALGIGRKIVITNLKDEIRNECSFDENTDFVIQKKLLGTGHAVQQTKNILSRFNGDLLVIYGDMPLLTVDTLRKLVDKHNGSLAACTLLTTVLKEPKEYGRIIRDSDGKIIKIVEARDASLYEKAVQEINVGVYCFRAKELFSVLELLAPDNKKGEYYLTDVIKFFTKKGLGIESIQTEDTGETAGVNSRQDLAFAQKVAKDRILDAMMLNGVGILDPSTTHIYNDVEIGQDTIIYPFTFIESDVKIGKKCKVGPFARIRPGTVIDDEVEIGNFTEIVRTKVGTGTRIKHQCFLGDAVIGANVNIGAGTSTANYDGKKINATRIDDNAFIGSGTTIIAPASIGRKAVTGAGSVIIKGSKIAPNSVVFGVPAKLYRTRERLK